VIDACREAEQHDKKYYLVGTVVGEKLYCAIASSFEYALAKEMCCSWKKDYPEIYLQLTDIQHLEDFK
jgi:tryptophan synthase beta subunit